jgi:hypothetical protein
MVAGLAAAPGPAGAASSAEIVAALNAQREANGIPAGITERGDWSANCAQHNEYMQQNGSLTHDEDPGAPGYTSGGAWAGQNSVLASGSTWSAGNPFEEAPIHLHQLLAARLSEMGADERYGWVCATTWPGMNRSHTAAGVLYSYPGDGRTEVPAAQTVSESPFTPGDFVGLPEGTTTGPHLYVMVDVPGDDASAQITSASLTGPRGPEDVRWVDNHTDQIGPYLPPGGIVIPAHPLARGAGYTASVAVVAGGEQLSRTWSFTTVPNRPPSAGFDVYPRFPYAGDEVTFASRASDPDGDAVSVEWDLDGDGSFEAAGGSVSRSFPAGTHAVTMRATDADGATATATDSLQVASRPVPPAADPVTGIEPPASSNPYTRCLAAQRRERRLRLLVRSAQRNVRRARRRAARRRWQRILLSRRIRLAGARATMRSRC